MPGHVCSGAGVSSDIMPCIFELTRFADESWRIKTKQEGAKASCPNHTGGCGRGRKLRLMASNYIEYKLPSRLGEVKQELGPERLDL